MEKLCVPSCVLDLDLEILGTKALLFKPFSALMDHMVTEPKKQPQRGDYETMNNNCCISDEADITEGAQRSLQ